MTDLNYNKFEAIARQAKVNLLVTTLRHCAVLVMPGMVRPSDLLVRAEAWTDSDWAILEQLCGAELKHTASATTRAAVVEALREMAQDEQEHDIARRPGWELASTSDEGNDDAAEWERNQVFADDEEHA